MGIVYVEGVGWYAGMYGGNANICKLQMSVKINNEPIDTKVRRWL